MTEIYLIRHTQAEGNRYRMMQGFWDGGVTDLGKKQIEALEERFRDFPMDAVYSSDLKRAVMTAEAVARRDGGPIRTSRQLREINIGPWEKKFFGNVCHETPDLANTFMYDAENWQMDGAETYAQVRDRALAELKNRAVARAYPDEAANAVILSADTVVWSPEWGLPLGKPKDRDDAVRMLEALSGKSHEVITGVMLRDGRSGRESLFSETTEVFFRELGREEILRYADSGDPMDKAGAYGIQSGACVFVRGIRGDYFNVVGLPVCRVSEELSKLTASGE